jgi:hypothetical protein
VRQSDLINFEEINLGISLLLLNKIEREEYFSFCLAPSDAKSPA